MKPLPQILQEYPGPSPTPNPETEPARGFQPSDFALHALLALPILALIWLYRFLPLQDYPDWLYQGYVLFRMIGRHPLPGYTLAPFPVPNSTCTVLMGLLDVVFAPEVSGKIFVSMTVLAFLGGSVYFITAFDDGAPNALSYVPFLFVYNVFLVSGYVNYILSLGLLFIGIGYLMREGRAGRQLGVALLAVLSILIYFSHLLSYMSWLIALGALMFFAFDASRIKRCCLAVAPSLILMAWYTVHRLMVHDVVLRMTLDNLLARKLIDAAKAFCLFTATELFPARSGVLMGVLAAANLGAAILVGALGVYWLWRIRATSANERFLVVSGLMYLLSFALAPAWLGGEWWPGDRFLFPAAWITFACLGPQIARKSPVAEISIKGVILTLFIIQVGYLNWFAHGVSRKLARQYADLQEDQSRAMHQLCDSFRNQETNLPSAPSADEAASTDSRHSVLARFYRGQGVPVLHPLFHLPYYLWIEQGQPALIFPTGPILYRAESVPADGALSYDAMLSFGERSLCDEPLGRP